jgi:hypothetical protein
MWAEPHPGPRARVCGSTLSPRRLRPLLASTVLFTCLLGVNSFIMRPSKGRDFVQPRASGVDEDIDPDTTYFQWIGRQLELRLRPKPYTEGNRPRLDRDVAVLLMRGSYEVRDGGDAG